jgi:transposase
MAYAIAGHHAGIPDKADLRQRVLANLADARALMKRAAREASGGPERYERDVEVHCSLPGVGRVVAATILAEASQPLAERNDTAARSYAAIAPVTRQAEKKKQVST